MIGVNLHQERLARLVLAARIGQRIRHIAFETDGLDGDDLHGRFEPPCNAERLSGTVRSGRSANPTCAPSGRFRQPSVLAVKRCPPFVSSVYSMKLPRKRARLMVPLVAPAVPAATRSISSGRTAMASISSNDGEVSGKAMPMSVSNTDASPVRRRPL